MCFLVISLLIVFFLQWSDSTPACDSPIYCDGPLLHAVQMARLFPDSKTFVDMSMKNDTETTLKAFAELTKDGPPSKQSLRSFVETYFSGPGEEFTKWIPADHVESPSFLTRIKDETLRGFAKSLCSIWIDLGKQIKDEVRDNPERHSLIYLKNPFIVPGGRFREIYYWDSYWIVKGLLLCEMHDTVKGMLENLISLVQRYGIVPNGGRIYYTRRSQPPFLIPMVDAYMEATEDEQFLVENVQFLEKEYDFWMTNRTVTININGTDFKVNRYATDYTEPRPESYREDFLTTQGPNDGASPTTASCVDVNVLCNEWVAHRQCKINPSYMLKKCMKSCNVCPTETSVELQMNLASAAETGWDFSSRWFSRHDDVLFLNTTVTRDIIPVDLNSILCWNEHLLAKFFNRTGQFAKHNLFKNRHQQRKAAFDAVFWNSDVGSWQDYFLSSKSLRNYFFPSNVVPWFTGCVSDTVNRENRERTVLNYMKKENVLEYKGGVPTSKTATGQQWDFPNAWPPLQHMLIMGLKSGSLQESREEALRQAKNWVYTNWLGWKQTGRMKEKYLVTTPGIPGGGGEYEIQEGFGWTNGVILDVLSEFGGEIWLKDLEGSGPSSSATTVSHTTCYLMVTILLFHAYILLAVVGR